VTVSFTRRTLCCRVSYILFILWYCYSHSDPMADFCNSEYEEIHVFFFCSWQLKLYIWPTWWQHMVTSSPLMTTCSQWKMTTHSTDFRSV